MSDPVARPASTSGEPGPSADPVVRAASAVIGGPPGRRLAPGRSIWQAAPVLILLAVAVLAAGVVQKQHCRAQGWSSPDMFWHACYSDLPIVFSGKALDADPRPGLRDLVAGDAAAGQPPLASAAIWVTSGFVGEGGVRGQREFFDLSALLLAALLAVAVAAVAALARRSRGRPWDAAHLALSPVLVTAGLISYALLAVALLALSLRAWQRERPVPAGIWLGLAVAASPALAVVVLALGVLGARTRWPVAPAVAAAVVTWFGVRLVVVQGVTGGLADAFTAWRTAAPGYGSLWLVPQLLGRIQPNPPTSWPGRVVVGLTGWIFHLSPLSGRVAAVLSVLLFAALVAAVVRLTATRPPADPAAPAGDPAGAGAPDHAPDDAGLPGRVLAPLALALLCAALVCATSLPVQSSLLLLPLIALSGLAWRDHLIWAVGECAYFVGVWLFIAADSAPGKGLSAPVFLVLLLARLGSIGWIGVQAVRRYRADLSAAGRRPTPLGFALWAEWFGADPSRAGSRAGRHAQPRQLMGRRPPDHRPTARTATCA